MKIADEIVSDVTPRGSLDPFSCAEGAATGVPGSDAGRSPEQVRRIAIHEASHAVASRALDRELGGATIKSGPDYGGMVWGPKGDARKNYSEGLERTLNLYASARSVMPSVGESRSECAEYYEITLEHVIELLAGTEGERLLCEGEPLVALSDEVKARLMAEGFCCSGEDEEVVTRFLDYCRGEARAIIRKWRDAVMAVADDLVGKQTLDAAGIDAAIFRALAVEDLQLERTRRSRWATVIEKASKFLQVAETSSKRQ
jgi:hypothetical protein